MKRISTMVMLLCIAVLSANAQLLWKVSGKNLPKASYVLGTHHLAPLSILDSIAGFKQAMTEVEQVYGEIVMVEMQTPAAMQQMQPGHPLAGRYHLAHAIYPCTIRLSGRKGESTHGCRLEDDG